MFRGVVSLPRGTGKQVRVLVLCTPDAEAAAKEAGADYVGLDEYIEKIKGGWTDIDAVSYTHLDVYKRQVTYLRVSKEYLFRELLRNER